MTTKCFTKHDLKQFIIDTIELAHLNPEYSHMGVSNTVNARVDLFCKPLEEWIRSDGELDAILDIIDKIFY